MGSFTHPSNVSSVASNLASNPAAGHNGVGTGGKRHTAVADCGNGQRHRNRSRPDPTLDDTDTIQHEGAFSSAGANGGPWLVGFGPGQYPSGLGFVLKTGSPAINKGVRIDQVRIPNNDIHVSMRNQLITDALGRPMDYVDDPVNGSKPDVGAYEYGLPQVPGAPRYYNNPGHPAHGAWIPGCTLPREFIEGQPWKRQWQ